MKLDIGKTINGLESLNKRLGFGHSAVCDAIKVCRMWRRAVRASKNYATEDTFNMLAEIEEEFFPSIIKQTVTIEIQGKNEEALHDTIQQVRLTYGVKDVRPHDSRY